MNNIVNNILWEDISSFYLSGTNLKNLIKSIKIDDDKASLIIIHSDLAQRRSGDLEILLNQLVQKHYQNSKISFLYENLEKEGFLFSDFSNKGKYKIRIPNVKNIISLVSCKGGVGKSINVVNLAYSLLEDGYKVGILDADIYGPSIPRILGVNAKPNFVDNKIQPIIVNNLKTISLGYMIEEKLAAIWRGPILSKSFFRLFEETNWGELDYLLIDTPPGTGDIHLSLNEKIIIDGSIVITTPQILAVDEAYRMISMLKRFDTYIYGIIENMSYLIIDGKKQYIFGQDGGKILAKESEIEFLGEINLEPEINRMIEEKNYKSLPKSLQKSYKSIKTKLLKV